MSYDELSLHQTASFFPDCITAPSLHLLAVLQSAISSTPIRQHDWPLVNPDSVRTHQNFAFTSCGRAIREPGRSVISFSQIHCQHLNSAFHVTAESHLKRLISKRFPRPPRFTFSLNRQVHRRTEFV